MYVLFAFAHLATFPGDSRQPPIGTFARWELRRMYRMEQLYVSSGYIIIIHVSHTRVAHRNC
jgi:hypothetical protein